LASACRASALLLTNSHHSPGVECVAAADLWDGRHQLAREITGKPNLFATRKYQELLDNKEIDCIVAAVPDHWHKRVVVDATTRARKDIYCEKPMSHTAAEGVDMANAQKKNGRIVQIGSQRGQLRHLRQSKENDRRGVPSANSRSSKAGFGRNDPTGAWEYPPPPGLSPQNFDWDTWQSGLPPAAWDADHVAEMVRPLALLERRFAGVPIEILRRESRRGDTPKRRWDRCGRASLR